MKPALNMQEALKQEEEGVFEPFLFFGHHGTGVGPHVLSQWWTQPFKLGQYTFNDAETAMMVAKAVTFKDHAIIERMLAAVGPKEVKALGRKVKNFDEAVWEKVRYGFVLKANIAKFGQNPELKEYLLSTGSRTLIESSPYDRVWGTGLKMTDIYASSPSRWRGRNLLGFALTEAREQLR